MSEPRTKNNHPVRRIVALFVIPALLYFAFYDSNIHGPVDLFHEGESLSPASETLRGKLPFRDVYLQHGWGVNLLKTRAAFSLFGASVAANRRMTHGDVSGFLIAASWTGVYFFLYGLFRRKLWILPAFLLLAFADVLINDRHLLCFLSVAMLAAGDGSARLPLFFAGMFAALGVFYSLDTGLYALAIAAVFIPLNSYGRRLPTETFGRAVSAYTLGIFVGALPFLTYLVWVGILDEFFRNCYFQVRYQAVTWGMAPPSPAGLMGPFENATARNRALYLFVKWYYPAFVYFCVALFVGATLMRRRLQREESILLLVTVMGLVFFRSAMGRADEGHLMYSIAPFWVLNVCYLERAFLFRRGCEGNDFGRSDARFEKLRRLGLGYPVIGLMIIGLALYFAATCRNGGIVARRARLETWKEKNLPRCAVLDIPQSGGIKVPPEQAEQIKRTTELICRNSSVDEPIFDFSNQGAYYFLADRANSTSYCQAAYAIPARLQTLMLAELGRVPPALILSSDSEEAAWAQARLELVDKWVRERYSAGFHVQSDTILIPSGSSPAPLPEVGNRSGEAGKTAG